METALGSQFWSDASKFNNFCSPGCGCCCRGGGVFSVGCLSGGVVVVGDGGGGGESGVWGESGDFMVGVV